MTLFLGTRQISEILSSPSTKKITVPAKALLFGEYAGLFHYPCITLAFFQYFFQISYHVEKSNKKSQVIIESDFFENHAFCSTAEYDLFCTNRNLPFFGKEIRENQTPVVSSFFEKVLSVYKKYLDSEKCKIVIRIEKSFPQDLGFGSSSALISATNIILYSYFFSVDFSQFKIHQDHFFTSGHGFNLWQNAMNCLEAVQGTGSGYDVTIQIFASLTSIAKGKIGNNTQIFRYTKNIQKEHPSLLQKLQISRSTFLHLGCFVKTNVYSQTTQKINNFLNSDRAEYFAKKHGSISEKFSEDLTTENVRQLVSEAQEVCQEQGLLIQDSILTAFYQLLKKQNIPYKSMGAGFGDCLWVMAPQTKVVENIRSLHAENKLIVVYDFAEDNSL